MCLLCSRHVRIAEERGNFGEVAVFERVRITENGIYLVRLQFSPSTSDGERDTLS